MKVAVFSDSTRSDGNVKLFGLTCCLHSHVVQLQSAVVFDSARYLGCADDVPRWSTLSLTSALMGLGG